ncbi:MAG: GNAT family N-acetyltransferase [Bacilli bacterium]|nr:GNAT family N-acetyltransferase [Bacilli bacterium]
MSKIILSKKDYQIIPLDSSAISDLLTLQEDAFLHLEAEDLLRANSKEVLLDCLVNHYVLGVRYKQKLIAFGILYFGKQTSENIGYDLNLLREDVQKLANIKLIIVHSSFQGNGLQRQLIWELEKEARNRAYTRLACTISPNNRYSLNNFLALGFEYVMQKKKYNGLTRNIYLKNLDSNLYKE